MIVWVIHNGVVKVLVLGVVCLLLVLALLALTFCVVVAVMLLIGFARALRDKFGTPPGPARL